MEFASRCVKGGYFAFRLLGGLGGINWGEVLKRPWRICALEREKTRKRSCRDSEIQGPFFRRPALRLRWRRSARTACRSASWQEFPARFR